MDCTGYFGNAHKASFKNNKGKSFSSNVFEPYNSGMLESDIFQNSKTPSRPQSGLPTMNPNKSKMRTTNGSMETQNFSKLTNKIKQDP